MTSETLVERLDGTSGQVKEMGMVIPAASPDEVICDAARRALPGPCRRRMIDVGVSVSLFAPRGTWIPVHHSE